MRFTVILAMLFAITMVTMANRMKKFKKLKEKAHKQKLDNQQQAVCDVVSWGPCENGQITQTVSPNTTNPACQGPIIHEATIQHTMMCVTQTNDTTKRCAKVSIVRNFTSCQNGGDTYTLQKIFDCAGKKKVKKDIEFQKPCGIRIKELRVSKGEGKAKVKGARKEKKMFRKKLALLRKQGCTYTCVAKQMKWTLKEGDDVVKCDAELQGPCFKAFKNKKGGSRRQRGGRKRS